LVPTNILHTCASGLEEALEKQVAAAKEALAQSVAAETALQELRKAATQCAEEMDKVNAKDLCLVEVLELVSCPCHLRSAWSVL